MPKAFLFSLKNPKSSPDDSPIIIGSPWPNLRTPLSIIRTRRPTGTASRSPRPFVTRRSREPTPSSGETIDMRCTVPWRLWRSSRRASARRHRCFLVHNQIKRQLYFQNILGVFSLLLRFTRRAGSVSDFGFLSEKRKALGMTTKTGYRRVWHERRTRLW